MESGRNTSTLLNVDKPADASSIDSYSVVQQHGNVSVATRSISVENQLQGGICNTNSTVSPVSPRFPVPSGSGFAPMQQGGVKWSSVVVGNSASAVRQPFAAPTGGFAPQRGGCGFGFPVNNSFQRDFSSRNQSANYQNSGFTSDSTSRNRSSKPGMRFEILPNGYQVLAWSISGIETNVLVRKNRRLYAFDMGHAHRETVNAEYVFISHGHIDHIVGIIHHASKRNLYRLSPATYFVPAHLVEHVREIGRQFAIMQTKFDFRLHREEPNDTLENQPTNTDSDSDRRANQAAAVQKEIAALNDMNIVSVENGKRIKLANGDEVLPFATCHRVPSSGYLIYRKKFNRQTSETTYEPAIAYTGDTTFDIFLNPPVADLLRVSVLICECTYIGHSSSLQPKASEYKHIHFDSFVANAALFEHVEQIVLVHFSDRHPSNSVRRLVDETCPSSLRGKIFCALMAQDYGL